MEKDGLIIELTGTFGKSKVNKLSVILTRQNLVLRDLVDITFNADKTIAYRSAWILENLFLIKPGAFIADLDYFLTKFKQVKYESCQRHYAKVMMHITSPKAPAYIQEKLINADLEPVVEKLFDWIINQKTLVAVKVFSAETLFNLSSRYPWINDELENQLLFMMRNGSAAIQSRGKKLLIKLNSSKLESPRSNKLK